MNPEVVTPQGNNNNPPLSQVQSSTPEVITASVSPALNQTNAATLSKDGVLYQAPHTNRSDAPTGRLELINNGLVFSDTNGLTLLTLNVSDITKLWQANEMLAVIDKTSSLLSPHGFYFPGWKKALAGTNLGMVGATMEYQAEKSSGIQDWITAIHQANPNIKIRNLSVKKLWVYVTIFSILFIAIVTAIVMLTSKKQ